METTRLSSKGQIIIPQTIRDSHHWKPGLEFVVTETNQGILLIPRSPFKRTAIENILGCIPYKGKKKSLKDMKAGIAKGAKKQNDRD